MQDERFEKLYQTQDKILDLVAKSNLNFYLTGGTALQRFHYNSFRYSEDLDFFFKGQNLDKNEAFKEFNNFKKLLDNNNIEYNLNVFTPDYAKIIVKENNLKIDLVNESLYHKKDDYIKLENGLVIDGKQSIFINKLETIASRDEPRDLFDIYTLLKYNKMDINESFDSLAKRTNWDKKSIVDILQQVDLNKIKPEKILIKNDEVLNIFYKDFKKIIENTFVSEHKQEELEYKKQKFFKDLKYLIDKKDILIQSTKENIIKKLNTDYNNLNKANIFNNEEKNKINNIFNNIIPTLNNTKK